MKWCKRCVQPDTRPGIQFDEEGICPPCRYVEKRFEIDWEARKRELWEIVEFGRKNNHFGYDCVIGVSGGKDSTRQALYAREVLGMKPLLVCCTYPPEQLAHRGAHNLANLISLGFDTITIGPSPQIWRKLMRYGFLKHGNWAKSTELALYSSAPKVAIGYHIPLVFLGENPAITLGDSGVRSVNADANRMRHSNTLAGADPSEYFIDNIGRKDLLQYCYPTDEEMDRANLKIRYLGYYWPDFTKVENACVAVGHGLHVREDKPEDCGSWGMVQSLDEDFVIVNQMLKYLKYGFGMVTDEVCEEIRYGRMTRDEAIELVRRYDGRCSDEMVGRFCDYIQITREEFWTVAESYRNKNIWRKDGQGRWELAYAIG